MNLGHLFFSEWLAPTGRQPLLSLGLVPCVGMYCFACEEEAMKRGKTGCESLGPEWTGEGEVTHQRLV